MNQTRCVIFIIGAALAYFAPNILSGGAILPLDILHQLGPFSATTPADLKLIRNPHLSDLVTMIHPWMEFFRAAEERFPLWNPYSFCGSPLLASAQAGLLFPLSWCYRFLPVEIALLCIAVGKITFAGIFAFLFYRRLGFVELACLMGALSYMLSGHLIVWLGYPAAFPIITLPCLFWALERYLFTQTLRDLVLVSAAYGLLFLGGQPQFGFVIALASILYFVIRARPKKVSKYRLCLSAAAAGILGFCLASPQILPFLEYLRESAALHLRSSFGWKLYPWFTLLSWMVPRFFGDLREGNFWGFSSMVGEAVFIGAVPLIFATLGLVLARKDRFYWAILAVFSLGFFGLYVPYAQWLFQRIPLLSHIDNNKLMVLVTFGLTSLAVAGFNQVVTCQASRQRLFLLWHSAVAFWVVFVGIGILYFRRPIREMRLERFEARELAFHLAFLILASAMLWLWKNKKLSTVQTAFLLVLFSVGDLFRVWINYYPSYPVKYIRPRSSALEFLQKNLGENRLFGLDGLLPPETSILYRLQDARGIEGLTPYRYYRILGKIDAGVHDLLARLQAGAPKENGWTSTTLFYRSLEPVLKSDDPQILATLRHLDYWSNDISKIERPHLLTVLGIRYILSPQGNRLPAAAGFRHVHSSDAEVWENPRVLPKAFVSTQPIFVKDDAEALERISDQSFLSEKAAIICCDDKPKHSDGEGAKIIPAQIINYFPHLVELTAESPNGGYLILSDLFYPGWQAFLDGNPVPILRANYLFRGIEVPPGRHRIRFRYHPSSFYGGAIVSLVAVIILSAIYLRSPVKLVISE